MNTRTGISTCALENTSPGKIQFTPDGRPAECSYLQGGLVDPLSLALGHERKQEVWLDGRHRRRAQVFAGKQRCRVTSVRRSCRRRQWDQTAVFVQTSDWGSRSLASHRMRRCFPWSGSQASGAVVKPGLIASIRPGMGVRQLAQHQRIATRIPKRILHRSAGISAWLQTRVSSP